MAPSAIGLHILKGFVPRIASSSKVGDAPPEATSSGAFTATGRRRRSLRRAITASATAKPTHTTIGMMTAAARLPGPRRLDLTTELSEAAGDAGCAGDGVPVGDMLSDAEGSETDDERVPDSDDDADDVCVRLKVPVCVVVCVRDTDCVLVCDPV